MAGFEKLADLLVKTIQAAMKTTTEKVSALELRVGQLESCQLKYFDIYEPGTQYPQGSLVTRSGAMWLAKRSTSAVPGQDHNSWKLVVKSGGAQ